MCRYYNNNLSALCNLWETVIEGNHSAYTILYNSLYPVLYSYILQMVKDEELTNDLLQDLFIKLWDKREQIGTVNNVRAYFFTSSRSMAINHFRQVKSHTSRLEHFIQPEFDRSPEDVLVSVEESNQLKDKMKLALNMLPTRQREIIHLKYYQGMEYQKIAELTGIQYQSVVNHVFRGLHALRSEFKPYQVQMVS